MLDVPYFKQDTGYSCGPASLQMVFAYWGKKLPSEEYLMKSMKTNIDVGTLHSYMINESQKRGLYTYINNQSSFEEIDFMLRNEHPVIVHYIEPFTEFPHYSVVIDITEHTITVHDPLYGSHSVMTRKNFEERWHDEKNTFKKWIMVLSTEDFSLGKQFKPY